MIKCDHSFHLIYFTDKMSLQHHYYSENRTQCTVHSINTLSKTQYKYRMQVFVKQVITVCLYVCSVHAEGFNSTEFLHALS